MRRLPFYILLFLSLTIGLAHAQATQEAETLEDAEPTWSLSLSAYTYFVPDDDDFVQPTLALDRDWLHLEARYNYESLDTTSLWVGYNFSFGEELTLDITPMVGGVFGDLDGVAVGCEFTLAWRGLSLYNESEYVCAQDSSDSFFYTWAELTYSPVEWLRAGIAVQRTQLYESDIDIQRGLVIGVTYKHADVALYVFNLEDQPTFILGISFEF